MNTVTTGNLRQEIWGKSLYKDVIDHMYFTENGMMGVGDNFIIELKNELSKEKGDIITFGLTTKLGEDGITGDDELEGQEEAIDSFSESISIDQIRHAVRLRGNLDEQYVTYNMRVDARGKLSIWLQEFTEKQIFQKLGGVTNVQLTDIAGKQVNARCQWSNVPDYVPDADTAAGYGARYLCADYVAGADDLATTDLMTPALISRINIKAETASPKVRALKIKGKLYRVLFIHTNQAFDLHNNATYAQAMREAQKRGNENPIFTGADAIWDGVIVHTHPYVPYLDIDYDGGSGASQDSFRGYNTGTDFTADAFRAILCGRQAIGFAKCKNPNAWVEIKKDYQNKTGFSTGLIGGIQKILFDSKNYGCLQLDTSATILV